MRMRRVTRSPYSSDGVELPAASGVAQVPPRADQDHDGDQGEQGDPEEGAGAEREEVPGQVGGVDAVASGPEHVYAPVGIQGAEGDHECRHPGEGDEGAIDQAEQAAEHDPGQEHRQHRDAGEVDEQPAGEVGGETEYGSHRQVDAAGDDDDGLAHGHENQDRRRQQQIPPAV
jgi:hypothetical protein